MTRRRTPHIPDQPLDAAERTELHRLRQLFAMMPQGVVFQDQQGMITATNPAALRILGLTEEQITGRTSLDLRWQAIHEDGTNFPGEHHPAMIALRTEAPNEAIMGVFHPEQQRHHWLHVNATPYHGGVDTEKIEAVIVTFDDITNLRDAHSEVAQRAQELETFINAITDGVLIYNASGTITFMNPESRRIFGPTGALLLQTPQPDDRYHLLQLYDLGGKILPYAAWPIARILAGETLSGASVLHLRLQSPEGHQIPLIVSGGPIRSNDGQIVGGILILRDETEQQALKNAIQQTFMALLRVGEERIYHPKNTTILPFVEEDLAQIARLTQHVLQLDWVAIVTLDPLHERFDPQIIIGQHEQHTATWRSLIAAANFPRWRESALYEHLQHGETVITTEDTLPWMAEHLQSLVHAPIRSQGHLIGLVVGGFQEQAQIAIAQNFPFARDIGRFISMIFERAYAQREEARLRWMQEEFINIASHELRAPLTPLLMASQMILRAIERPDPHQKIAMLATDIVEHAKRMGRLIEDMLNMTRIETGRFDVFCTPCDLTATIQNAVQTQRNLTHREIRLVGVDEPIAAWVDAERIWQVLTNLLTNAIKYAPSPTAIAVTVKTQTHDDATPWAEIAVRDEGPGIPLAAQPHLFERFYRVAASGNQRDGLGLGLYIAHAIVVAHRGTITVDSTIGSGTTMIVGLPLRQG